MLTRKQSENGDVDNDDREQGAVGETAGASEENGAKPRKCSKCKRSTRGHGLPYGANCELEPLEDGIDIERDGLNKNPAET